MAGMFMGNLPLEDDAGKDRQSARTLAELLQAEREEREKYVKEDLPCDEDTMRYILEAVKNEGIYDSTKFDPMTCDLADILAPLYHDQGLRIVKLTDGIHNIKKHKVDYKMISEDYRVRKNDVFVTFDTTEDLNEFTPAGEIATYRLRYRIIGKGFRVRGKPDVHKSQ